MVGMLKPGSSQSMHAFYELFGAGENFRIWLGRASEAGEERESIVSWGKAFEKRSLNNDLQEA